MYFEKHNINSVYEGWTYNKCVLIFHSQYFNNELYIKVHKRKLEKPEPRTRCHMIVLFEAIGRTIL